MSWLWLWLGVPVVRGGGVVGGDAWRLEVWIGVSIQTDQSFCRLEDRGVLRGRGGAESMGRGCL